MHSEPTESEDIRLQVFLARAGVASRRGAEELIRAGHVRVNGKTVREMGTKVSENDEVFLKGRKIGMTRKYVYLALHKPARYLCSNSDPEGRALAVDLLRPAVSQRVFHVGRLDFLSSGLVLYTNDGDFAMRITHPRCRVEKEYEISTKQPVPEELMKRYLGGIHLGDETYTAVRYHFVDPTTVRVVLVEGKNREIRVVFQSARVTIKRLHRVRIGSVGLDGLRSGTFRPLTPFEVAGLRNKCGQSQ